jgi:hypothetical protein
MHSVAWPTDLHEETTGRPAPHILVEVPEATRAGAAV